MLRTNSHSIGKKGKGMTIKDVRARIQKIKDKKHDYEVAHILEDELRRDVLREIAKGTRKSRALAGEVLKSRHTKFVRDCA